MADEGQRHAKGDRLCALKATEQARRAQFPVRILVAAVGCGFLSVEMHLQTVGLLFAVIVFSQLGDTALKSAILRDDREEALAGWEFVLLCASNLQAASIYSFVAIAAWFVPDPVFKIFAGFWVSGSMLHVMLHMHHESRTFFSGFIPHASVAVGLPVVSYLTQDDVSLSTMGALLFTTSVFVGHFAAAFRTYQAQSRELREAKQLAEERRKSAEAASEAKTTFLATLSHEIRTPLNGIIGMATSLEEVDLPSEAQEQVRVLRQASDLLVVLLSDVLDVSKIEAGRLEVEDKPFVLHDILSEVVALHTAAAADKGIRLEAQMSNDTARHRRGDRHRLFQVLHNLVGNGIKFTEFGSVRVRLYTDEADRVVISVEDTGIGMSAEELSRVFQPFTQADSSTTRRYGGTGLGLTISKGLAEAMGGELTVQSEKNVGSTFTLHLPLPIAEAEAVEQSVKIESGGKPLQGIRILAVDDNAVNLKVLETLLKGEGCHLVTVLSGEQALGLFSPDAFDLVLLDISMPGLDGPATLSRMRKMAAERPMPPALAVTAHAMPEDVASFLSAGFDGVVAKPLRRADLLSAAAKALELRPQAADQATA